MLKCARFGEVPPTWEQAQMASRPDFKFQSAGECPADFVPEIIEACHGFQAACLFHPEHERFLVSQGMPVLALCADRIGGGLSARVTFPEDWDGKQ